MPNNGLQKEKYEVHGNTEGIRKTLLDSLAALYQFPVEADEFLPEDMMKLLCDFSATIGREIAVYITRYGEVADVVIGQGDHVKLPDLRLRRSNCRLNMVRCIHTHPNGIGILSDVDLSALLSMHFDAMCAIGVRSDGQATSTQCAFLDGNHPGDVQRTELLNARHIPQAEWLNRIAELDAVYSETAPNNISGPEKAILVGIESEGSLNELEELAKTAGAETIYRVLQKRPKMDTAFCIGKGKAEELSLTCQSLHANLVIFDEELTGNMQKNLEETLGVKVIDRTALILDIFASRAMTREGKLQVEMAQLQYRSQRLIGQGLMLSRLAGGIGTRGPGESKLEVSRRRIRERLTELQRALDEVQKQRSLRRSNREKNQVPVVALVGYTNAGKSTLFNRLTGADVFVENQLFATLDSVSRPVTLPHGNKVILVDTVGFIRKLPHELVKAFRATLEEAKLADLLVLVSDGADAECEQNHQTVEEVLASLEAVSAPRIDVLNKCDLFVDNPDRMPGAVRISAANGHGLELLLERIENVLNESTKEVTIFVPFSQYGLLDFLRKHGSIISEDYSSSDGVNLRFLADETVIQSALKKGVLLRHG